MQWRWGTHLHGNVALLDREELEGREGGLPGLGEAIHLHSQVVTLRVPEEPHICTPQAPVLRTSHAHISRYDKGMNPTLCPIMVPTHMTEQV